jgi:hypothetical protein
MTVISPYMYQALAIKSALQIYLNTGHRVNRAYTPSAMVKTASKITGKSFKPRDYKAAIDALKEWIDAEKNKALEGRSEQN